jgi:hypothetical protein
VYAEAMGYKKAKRVSGEHVIIINAASNYYGDDY